MKELIVRLRDGYCSLRNELLPAADALEEQEKKIAELEAEAVAVSERNCELLTDVAELTAELAVKDGALITLLHITPATLDCSDLNHPKKYQHSYDVPCPVMALYEDARDEASKALATLPQQQLQRK